LTAYLHYWVFCAHSGTEMLYTDADQSLRALNPTQGYRRNLFLFNALGSFFESFAQIALGTSPFCRSFPHGLGPRGRNRGHLLLLGAHPIASAVGLGPLLFWSVRPGVGIKWLCSRNPHESWVPGRGRGHLLLLGAHLIASAVGLGPLFLRGSALWSCCACRAGRLNEGHRAI